LFGEVLKLRGYNLGVTPDAANAEVLLALSWHAARHIGTNYSLFAHTINAADKRVVQSMCRIRRARGSAMATWRRACQLIRRRASIAL
jgi:hypothetical protein